MINTRGTVDGSVEADNTDLNIIAAFQTTAINSNKQQIPFTVCGEGELPILSDILPILENMGVMVISADSDTLDSHAQGALKQSWTIVLQLGLIPESLLNNVITQKSFARLFVDVYLGRAENDAFNRLITEPQLASSHIVVLRAITKYLAQLKMAYSVDYIQDCLCRHTAIAVELLAFFIARFDPDNDAETTGLQQKIERLLDAISTRDDDIILRSFFAVIQAMLRTNFYHLAEQKNPDAALSFKLAPERIPNMPLPVPAYEIFVYSCRVEGVHLRGGKVARGGIRWSERMEDYRTEVLGLIKTQMVKNAVIVPVGAKGGFICKGLVAIERTEQKQYVLACYREYISALLDITDNYVDGQIIPPVDVICHDDADPYLVVAADKGTATFSDLANEISAEYKFWLGDAFASGGQFGYDHKKMGITARGAWESAKRLFFELGIDIQKQEFTVIGIGDMSGDVFGNGMLLSEHIRLQVAFDHRHIFIDPDPDASTSFAERQRLFQLPSSSWLDYDVNLLSAGGQIIARSDKTVQLTPEAAQLLGWGVGAEIVSPDDIIKRLLQVPADLLWNGGVGTYVKASGETHLAVGDKHNDVVRVDAKDLQVKVVVEGGNLGLTQLARIEFAAAGGLVTTDAVDNSAGVDCSDHEVNIKILLDQVRQEGLIDDSERNQLLADMTDEVAELVLKHNRQQCRILSQSNYSASRFVDKHAQLIDLLEQEKRLNRELEYLPSADDIVERIKMQQGLLRPEISVLLGYSKTRLFRKLTEPDSTIMDDEYIRAELHNYFPQSLRNNYAQWIDKHPLRKEILASRLTNKIANRMGATFCNYVLEEQKLDASQLVKSYTVAYEVLGVREIERLIHEHAKLNVPSAVLLELQVALHHPVDRATNWLLRNTSINDVKTSIDSYAVVIKVIRQQLLELLPEQECIKLQKLTQQYSNQGINAELAARIAQLEYIFHAFEIRTIADQVSDDSATVTARYFQANEDLQLFWLRHLIQELPMHDEWQRKNKTVMLNSVNRALAGYVKRHMLQGEVLDKVSFQAYCKTVSIASSKASKHLAMVSVIVHRLHSVVEQNFSIQ